MIAALDPKLTWYVSRSAGLVAWLLCAAAVVWGLVLSTKIIRRRGLPAWLLDLHTFLGTLALVFTAIHLAALAVDEYVEFGWRELFVPMAAAWKPGPVAWGIVATYLLVAVQVTSWCRHRIPRRLWRVVHLSSFGLLVAGTVHGLAAGTDRSHPAVVATTVAVWAVVLMLTGARFIPRREAPARPNVAAARAAAATRAAATAGGVGQ